MHEFFAENHSKVQRYLTDMQEKPKNLHIRDMFSLAKIQILSSLVQEEIQCSEDKLQD